MTPRARSVTRRRVAAAELRSTIGVYRHDAGDFSSEPNLIRLARACDFLAELVELEADADSIGELLRDAGGSLRARAARIAR